MAVKQTEYESMYVSAIVNPTTGEAAALITEEVDTHVMNSLLANLSERVGDTGHAVLVWDGAGYHKSGTLEVPANVTLFPLPPYSPELNCVERVWLWMRTHDLSNRVFDDRAHIQRAIEDSCSGIGADRLKTICRTAWLERKD